jgi:hypothetical protein
MEIKIKIQDYNKLLFWSNLTHKVIMGFGFAREEKDTYHISGLIFPEQRLDIFCAEITTAQFNDVLTELRNNKQSEKDMRFMWVSHGPLRQYWSNESLSCLEHFKSKLDVDWYVGMVINNHGQANAIILKSTERHAEVPIVVTI